MKRSRLTPLLIIILALLSLQVLAFNPATPPTQRNAILFSWDGVQLAHLNECLSRNELPNLAALIAEGNFVKIDVTNHKTDTKAGHTQMLTGYDPDITGVMSNSNFKAIPEGLSIFERLESAFGDDNITTIMVTGKTHHLGNCPPSKPEDIESAKKKLKKLGPPKAVVPDPDAAQLDPSATKKAKQERTLREKLKATIQNTDGEPFFHTSKNIDVWDGEKSRTHDVNGPLMLSYLDKYGKGRFFAFFHFSDPDHAGHNHGENSREYNDAIIACDKWLGEIVKKLKQLGVYDRTMIFVTADHGFDEGKTTHLNAPNIYLAANLKTLRKNGNQRDITPTILTEMGVDISKIEPKYKGVVLTR